MIKDKDYIQEQLKDYESKINSKWRPMMGWLYMITCAFDFIIAPIGWSILEVLYKQPITQWNPLTLQGAGLYHVAMGAVLGIISYAKTQEKRDAMSIFATASPNYSYPEPQKPVLLTENKKDDK